MGAAFGLGLWFGGLSWWLVGALALYLAHMLRQLLLLTEHVQGKGKRRHFDMDSVWAELYSTVNGIRAKSRRRKKRFHSLLREIRYATDAIADAGVMLNADNEIVWFNDAATRLLGFTFDKDAGQRIDNLIRNPTFLAYLKEPTKEAVVIPGVVDSEQRLAVQLVPYGERQSLLIVRDITREYLIERTRRDFVANASHELRSPLTVVSGYLEGLEEDAELPAAWRKPLQEMQRQTQRMTTIIGGLINLSRMESSEGPAPREFVDVASLLERLVAGREPGERGPQLQLEVATDIGVLGAEDELHSVFANLLENAIRHTPEDGEVCLTWSGDRDGAVFEVKDTGEGIPQELVPRITERFFRVDPGRSRSRGGTGLGLAIVKHAVNRHEGALEIESEIGVGSVFRVRFGADRLVHRGG